MPFAARATWFHKAMQRITNEGSTHKYQHTWQTKQKMGLENKSYLKQKINNQSCRTVHGFSSPSLLATNHCLRDAYDKRGDISYPGNPLSCPTTPFANVAQKRNCRCFVPFVPLPFIRSHTRSHPIGTFTAGICILFEHAHTHATHFNNQTNFGSRARIFLVHLDLHKPYVLACPH